MTKQGIDKLSVCQFIYRLILENYTLQIKTYLDLLISSLVENIEGGGRPEPDRLKFLRPPGILLTVQ